MGFYTELKKHFDIFWFLGKFNIDNAIPQLNVFQRACVYRTMGQISDENNIPRILYDCIKNEVWGLVAYILATYSSRKGVDTALINNYKSIPNELKASLLSIECIGLKWTNLKLNDLFLESIKQNNQHKKESRDSVTVYYALGWNEDIITAFNNPCWFEAFEDACNFCFLSQIHFSKYKKEISSSLFFDGELHGINTLKTRVLVGKIDKKDILAEINPRELSEYFCDIHCIIQNKKVYDIYEAPTQDVIEGELLSLKEAVDFLEDMQNLDPSNIYDEIIASCEDAGLPKKYPLDKIKNKSIESQQDIANLIMACIRMKKRDVVRSSREICKSDKNTKWIYSKSDGYKWKKDYFYKGLYYSYINNEFFVSILRYKGKNNFEIFAEDLSHISIPCIEYIALDYESESTSFQECYEKCTQKEDSSLKNVKYKIQYIKEELTVEEKEIIKRNYIEEVDEEYQKEIQMHKDNADSKLNELEVLKNKYEEALRENDELKYQLAKKQSFLDKQSEFSILSMGKEKEKYDGETHAMVLSAIRHELKNCDLKSRRHDVLKGVLEKNTDDNDPISSKLAEIKKITKGYRIASEMKPGLIKQGFQYTEDGKHPKIQYPNDDRYIVTTSSTNSEVRSGKNLYAEIKKKFF